MGGQLYPEKHEPVVTAVACRRCWGRGVRKEREVYTFAYRGLIRCGACGLQLTTEHKVNRYGSRYIYYHCTRIHRTPRCRQPSIEARELDRQLRGALCQIFIPDALHAWAHQQLAVAHLDDVKERELRLQNLHRSITEIERHFSNLTDLRIRGLIEGAEFLTRRKTMQGELYRLQETLRTQEHRQDRFEPGGAAFVQQ